MAYNVQFLKGTAAAYEALTKNANTFYHTTDDNQVYLGTIKLSNGADLTAALSRIAANEDNIEALQDALDVLNGDDTTAGSVAKQIKDAIDALENQLADVATSGAAADVSIADEDDNFTSTNVEDALAELVDMIDAGGSGSVVAVTAKATPNQGYLKTYVVTQGQNNVGEIDIPKDLVVTSGEIVVDPSGQPAGTYIKLTIANQDNPLFINVADLVDTYTAQQNATQVQLAISNANEISGTIVAGSISSAELGTGAVTTTKIADDAVTTAKLSDDIVAILDKADAAVTTIQSGTADGTIKVTYGDNSTADVAVTGLGSAAYTASTAYDAAGAAAAVLGESTDGADANTVYGAKAAAAQAAGLVAALDSTVDAGQGGYIQAVMQADGLVSATTASLPDYSNVYEPINTASTLIAGLNTTDAAVANQYVSAVSQSNGTISVTRAALPDYSSTYDAYGAADTAYTNATTYVDNALTWGSF